MVLREVAAPHGESGNDTRAAALDLLQRIDELWLDLERDLHAGAATDLKVGLERGERSVHRLLRQVATGTTLTAAEVWNAALEIERDPLEKLRGVLGNDWQPNLF